MSWIDDVKATLDMTNKTAERVKNGTATTENVRSDWEQIQAAKNAAIAERETYNAQLEGVKKAQKDLVNKTLGIVGPKDWDKNIEEGYDKEYVYREENGEIKDGHWETSGHPRNIISEENPLMSFNREIPQTDLVKKIQSGQYKLASDTNRTLLNNDAALYIVGNTYQTNKDGTNYGIGWNGRPYSYTVKGGIVGEFNELGPDEGSKAISRLTEGKVTADPTTLNSDILASIYRSLERIKNYNNGNLPDGYINIGAMTDEEKKESYSLKGLTETRSGTKDDPVQIRLRDDYYDPDNIWSILYQKNSGWWTTGNADSVTQHELGHALHSILQQSPDAYYKEVSKEAEKFDKSYSASDLKRRELINFINSAKYIPVAMGFVTAPSYEEWNNFINDGKRVWTQEDEDFYNYWREWFATKHDADYTYDYGAEDLGTIGEKMRDRAWDVQQEIGSIASTSKMLNKAAKNAGYDNLEDAKNTSSEYGRSDNFDYELIAESIADVLINKENATDFSKEYVKLMEESAEKIRNIIEREEKKSGKKKYPEIKSFLSLIDLLPQYGGGQEYGGFLNQVKSLNIK